MSNPTRRRARAGTIDGLKIRIIDEPAASVAEVGQALRLLARMMVHNHQHAGDHTVVIPASQTSSALTVDPNSRPDHVDDAA